MRVWVITWESIGKHARVKKKVAGVLNSRISGERVREFVELLCANEYLSLREWITYAKKKHNTPYPARFDLADGIPFEGRISCGDNPFLYARLVDNFHVELDARGNETAKWDELPLPDFKRIRGELDRR